MKVKVGILGINGLVGQELFNILSRHSNVEIIRILKNQKIPQKVQIVFLCLPTEASMDIVPSILKQKKKIVDLSGAYRLWDKKKFHYFYHTCHTHPEILGEAIYGLPEKNRARIRDAQFIANPGCYATGIELGLLPLAEEGLLAYPDCTIKVFGISGYTGGGKNAPIPNIIKSYKPHRQHQHIPEVEQELGLKEKVSFYPHVAFWPRGIILNIIINNISLTAGEYLLQIYQDFFREEPFIQIFKQGLDARAVKKVKETNFCFIAPLLGQDKEIKIEVALDNLWKGAAGQAVQNFNIMYGFPEESSLIPSR